MLDAQRKVAGVGEYDPFGHVNRVSLDKESVHPYNPLSLTTTTLADFVQPVGGTANPSSVISLRALFHLVGIRSYTTFDSGFGIHHIPPSTFYTATMSLIDGDTSSLLWSGSQTGANYWSGWVQPGAGHARLNFTTNGWPPCAVGDDPPDFSLCTGGGTFADDVTGVVPEAYEYRRYQSGGAPFWTPLRFPGQYFDPETDLAQNWNRFYDSSSGRYQEGEPLLARSQILAIRASLAERTTVYGYGGDNPLQTTDTTGTEPSSQGDHPACDDPLMPRDFPYGEESLRYACNGKLIIPCVSKLWDKMDRKQKCAECRLRAHQAPAECREEATRVCESRYCDDTPCVIKP